LLLRAREPLQRVLAPQRRAERPEALLIDEHDRPSSAGVLRAAAAIVRADPALHVPRIAGVKGAVRAPDDVHEVHAVF
jgi:hypothetical protein